MLCLSVAGYGALAALGGLVAVGLMSLVLVGAVSGAMYLANRRACSSDR